MSGNSKAGGLGTSLTPATRLLNEKLGTSPEPGRLAPVEIELLRQSKQEIGRRLAESRTHHKVERAALDNLDLPISFVAESLMSMAEPRQNSLPFVPRGLPTDD